MTPAPATSLAAETHLRRGDGEALLARYRRTGDARMRDRAIELYLPLARRLAARYHRRSDSFEDLVQVACLGLVKAVERYDPERGTRFSSFAVPTITGELRRHFRATAWQLHVPRRVQEDALRVRDAAARLTHRLGRAPRVGELGDETGLDGEAISEALQARAVQATTSLDQPWGSQAEDGDATLAEQVGADDGGYGTVERKAMIEQLARSLPRREREVLYLRFACDLTQTEIARRLGCSQMQVSRILRRTLARLAEEAAAREAGATPPLPRSSPGGGTAPAGR